jgi:outer membrane protein assembly factor BamA
MKFGITSLCLVFFACLSALAQDAKVIAEISFSGCKANKEFYLRRFIRSQEQRPFQKARAESDVQRLKNLYSVSQARYQLEISGKDSVRLIFYIEEAWTLFPVLSIGGVEGNVWFEVGVNEINFLGRGMNLLAVYRHIDRRSNYQLYFRQPYLFGTLWGVAAGIHRYASIEPLYFPEGGVRYNYTNLSLELGGSYEFSPGHTAELGSVYFIEEYEKHAEQELLDPPGPSGLRLPKLLGKFIHRYDKVNHHYFYQDGFANVTFLETVYNLGDGTFFSQFLNDTHFFKRLGKRGNLALRIRLGLSDNISTPFAPFVLDSRVNIRGAGNRIDRGTGTIVINLEYRHTLWESRQFAVQGVVFSDAGAWRNPGGAWNDFVNPDYFRHFVGPGLRFIYKKAHNAIVRLDYGIDLYRAAERGFVVGFGQYF